MTIIHINLYNQTDDFRIAFASFWTEHKRQLQSFIMGVDSGNTLVLLLLDPLSIWPNLWRIPEKQLLLWLESLSWSVSIIGCNSTNCFTYTLIRIFIGLGKIIWCCHLASLRHLIWPDYTNIMIQGTRLPSQYWWLFS